MGKDEYQIIIFLVLTTAISLVFIIGFLVFLTRFHKRKLQFETEKLIMQQKHAEELLNTEMEIQEATMQSVGRELHDNIGQRLVLASLRVNALQQGSQNAADFADLPAVLNESLEGIRSISKSLMKSKELMAAASLQQLLEKECVLVNKLQKCYVTLQYTEGIPEVSGAIKNFIVRTVQEFTQNSLKHSPGCNIQLNFTVVDEKVVMDFSDDGKGFDVAAILSNPNKGIGLTNMKTRAEFIGATYTLESAPGQGIRVHIELPFDKLTIESDVKKGSRR